MIDYRLLPSLRGLHVPYREGQHCPRCGRANWWIGTSTAECAFCGTALYLLVSRRAGGIIRRSSTI